MENKELNKLEWKVSNLLRQFDYNQQGYSLVKCMVMRYALISIKKEVVSVREFHGCIGEFFWRLKEQVEQNIDEIVSCLGFEFKDMLLECIVSFSSYSEKESGFEQALYMMEELSLEALKEFIIYGFNAVMHRHHYGTPFTLCDLVAGIFDKSENSVIMDLGCGNGDFLVRNSQIDKNNLYLGYEINYDAKLLTKIRLTLLGVRNGIYEGNVLKCDTINKADYIFVEPPFGMKIRNFFDYKDELEYIYQRNFKPTQTSEWLFLDKALRSLNKSGKCAIVVPEGLLTNQSDVDQRRHLVDNNYIEAVIKLPQNLFSYTSIATSLLILSKDKNNNICKFLDASELSNTVGRSVNLRVDEILTKYNNGDCTSIQTIDIKENEYILSVNRYKGLNEIKIESPAKLGDLVEDIFRGIQIQADILQKYSTNEESHDVYKIVSPGDIVDGTFDTNTLEKIKIDKNYDRYLLRNNDLLISCKSTKIKTSIVEIKKDEKIIPSGSIIVVRCNLDKLSPVYLKMFLDSSLGVKLLASIQTGTTIISINPKALHGLIISCISLEKQKELSVDYLSALDMIRIEKSKIKKLEHKLKNIYDDFLEG